MNRTIWIGDVHGCAAELADLLEKIGPTTDDQVVFVGDLVARGPDTAGVLRLAREFKSSSVLGNHEHRMILARDARVACRKGPHLGPSHRSLLDELTEPDWDFLRSFPLSLDFPDHNIRVVHAGVVPALAFTEQQAWALLHMRSLTSQGSPSDRYSEKSWAQTYDEDPHIVFGHNAQAGLQLEQAATGLDTGCCYGGALTALVLSAGQVPPPPAERRDCLVSAAARDRYVDYGPHPTKVPLEV